MFKVTAGPQLRSPNGGNLVKAANWRASAALLIIGAIMPEAPRSSAREAVSNCPTGIRTIAGLPAKATCAIEGTLDLYELPATGTVPAQWTADQIWNTHRSSRTYADRILLLNSLRFRFPTQISESDVELRLLSNHMLAGDSAAARFYAQDLHKKAKAPEDAALFELTDILLAGREAALAVRAPVLPALRRLLELLLLRRIATALDEADQAGAGLLGLLVGGGLDHHPYKAVWLEGK